MAANRNEKKKKKKMGGRLCGNSLELFIWRSSLLCDIQIETYYTTPEMGIEGKKGAVCDLLGFGHVPSLGKEEEKGNFIST
jgi:hypothetical protein